MEVTCTKCKELKPADKFQKYKGKPCGQCRECKTAAMKEKRLRDGIVPKNMTRIEGNQKLCGECHEMKDFEHFSKTERGLGGLAAYCKVCFANKYRNSEKAKKATAKYRVVNRERYLANHRLSMFKRRTSIEATSDGTANDSFLKALYSEEYCFYCLQYTERKDRTADHKIPLAKGGFHSASNLVMSCFTCNSTKRDMTNEEFINRGINV